MQDILQSLETEDFRFLVGVIDGPLTPARRLRSQLEQLEDGCGPAERDVLCHSLEHEIRYLGSSDVAYGLRKALGKTPGVAFSAIVRDAANVLKVPVRRLGTDREVLCELVEDYVTREFSRRSRQEQQELLESLGIDRKRAAAFLKRSAGVFALPVLVQAFGTLVVDGLIKTMLFGLIAQILGRQLSARLFSFLFSRIPWWVGWIGPAAWTAAIGWTALDIQGPARRKTIPIVLYLGLCCMRQKGEVPVQSGAENGLPGADPA